jgi:hypothetical protein
MVGIYKISNPNGRIYIGQSTNIELRWGKYSKLHCKDQPSLYLSLKKHGEWESGKQASKELNIPQPNINANCNNKVKSAGGFIWKFKEQ